MSIWWTAAGRRFACACCSPARCLPLYGIYSGFELGENVPVRAGSEEYLDSEKYQLRPRDYDAPANINADIARLNEIRRARAGAPGVRQPVVPHEREPAILFYRKSSIEPIVQWTGAGGQLGAGDYPVGARRRSPCVGHDMLVAVNLDPHRVQETMVHVPIAEMGIERRRAIRRPRSAHRRAIHLARRAELRSPRSRRPAGPRVPSSRCVDRDRCSARHRLVIDSDALWYKDAIIYQLHIKSYRDSNADGFGDFRGLIEKLDYVQQLGANAIWLLPFYPSPLKDDGYDIASYEEINPTYGTIDDFRAFLAAAHERGIRVITELVINHTSDQHPWFQRARRAPKDSPERNWYVWSDDPNKYAGTRIIFTDTEKSNWSWDPDAQQFYWHRFFSHQPDLNFDNPEVLEAVINVMRFWLRMGVDGLRLDAIPYLIEREGTNCENLPETHEVLQAAARGARRRVSRIASFSPRRTSGRATCGRTSETRMSATWRSTFR